MSKDLTAKDRRVLRRLFGWHAGPWADAFSDILAHIDARPARVLEIGASARSAPSMFFLLRGASVEVTCYRQQELDSLSRYCERFCSENRLPPPSVHTCDIFDSSGKKSYDVILMKGVLGGLDRRHNIDVFAKAVDICMTMLKPGGHLVVMDKGWCSPLHNTVLRRFGLAGKNNWHYFSQRELDSLTDQYTRPVVVWRGFLSVGVMPYKWMQGLADGMDKCIFNQLPLRRGTVFAAAYGKNKNALANAGSRSWTPEKKGLEPRA